VIPLATSVVVVLCVVPLALLLVELLRYLLRRPGGDDPPSGELPPQPTTLRCAGCGADVSLATWRVERGSDGIRRLACPVCGLTAAGRVDA
jgi:hypothetical protein